MQKKQSITIKKPFDVILARMRVRECARAIGLGMRDQACIALATSSAAKALKLGETGQGYIDVYCSDDEERAGVQVICTMTTGAVGSWESKALANVRWMVEELAVETLPSNEVRATLVKWATWQ
jgi:hypothetical protein